MADINKNIFAFNNSAFKKNTQVISVTSGKGGVGKTNISINLAILLKQLNKKVLLFDADIHLGNVDVFLGLRPKDTIKDVVKGDKSIQETIIKGPKDIDILPASSAVVDLLEQGTDVIRKLQNAFSEFENEYDVVVIDTGAGLSQNVVPFVLGGDKVVIAMTRDPASIADAYGMIKVIRKFKEKMPILLLPNMVKSSKEGESLFKKMNLMVERFLGSSINYGGAIEENELVRETIKKQKAIAAEHPNSQTVKKMKNLTRTLLTMPQEDSDNGAFFDKIVEYNNISIGEEND